MTETKMNLLMTSAGRRTKLAQYFCETLSDCGNLVAVDCSPYAPALYIAHKGYIVPQIDAPGYLDNLLSICREEKIVGIFSLIDTEISLLAKNKKPFESLGIMVFISSYEACETCFDKMAFYQFLKKHGFNCAFTVDNLEDFKMALLEKKIAFPVFVKPRKGSASNGIGVINSEKEIAALSNRQDDIIIQQHLGYDEYGVDVYVDLLSREIVSIFAKKKLAMRAGETDKAISIIDHELSTIVSDLVSELGLLGPIDIDVFKIDNRYYISEINPRFGGGYPLAFECGEKFPELILNNMRGIKNKVSIGRYKEGVVMMKHDTLVIKEQSSLIKLQREAEKN